MTKRIFFNKKKKRTRNNKYFFLIVILNTSIWSYLLLSNFQFWEVIFSWEYKNGPEHRHLTVLIERFVLSKGPDNFSSKYDFNEENSFFFAKVHVEYVLRRGGTLQYNTTLEIKGIMSTYFAQSTNDYFSNGLLQEYFRK